MRKISWIIVGFFATLIGLYPSIYFMIDRRFGLLSTKTAELLIDNLWNISFYGHIIFGGFALLIGWLQFNNKLRERNIKLHKTIGKGYFFSVLISGVCGVYIALHATGGIISIFGFLILAIIWLSTTIFGLLEIRKGNISIHQRLMVFSYAACFAAVTLRIWLPILNNVIGEFVPAYRIVAWLCWVPNMIVAYLMVRKMTSANGRKHLTPR